MKVSLSGSGTISQRLLQICLLLSSGVRQYPNLQVFTCTEYATANSSKDWYFHEILLAGWGMPIGELFDLEKLAEYCKNIGRWSFFLSSEVCKVPGGVAR